MEALQRKNKGKRNGLPQGKEKTKARRKKGVERVMAEMEENVMKRTEECKGRKVESFHPKTKTSE